jgi:hypothetical protein
MHVHGRRIALVALVFGAALLSAGSDALAQARGANPFMGVWELDRFKSVYEPIATQPEKQILTIAAAPTAGQFTASTRTWRNAVANETTYTAAADGKDYPTTAARATVSFKPVNANTWERTAKLFDEVAETATWTVSADGKTLTIKREGVDGNGDKYSSTAFYNKVS